MKRNFKSLVMSAVSVIVLIFGLGIVSYAATEAEPNDGTNTATQISVDELHQGSLSSETDIDWYKFTTNADYFNFEFVVDPSVVDASKIASGWNITIYQGDGVTEVREFVGQKAGTVTANLALQGTYYIKVEARYSSSAPKNCTYGIKIHTTVCDHWESENNQTTVTADVIETDKTYNGSLYKYADIDWYKFTADKDFFRVSFELNESVDYNKVGSGWNVFILQDDGVTVVKEYYGVTKNFITPELPFTGNYLIKIEPRYSSSAPIDCYYDLTVHTTENSYWENEFNNDSSTATEIETDKTYYGALYKSNDVDYYLFSSDAEAYSVTFKPNEKTNSASLSSGWRLSIYPYGSSVEIVSYSGIISECKTFMLPFKGSFVIRVSSLYDSSAPLDCVYDLRVNTCPENELWEAERNDSAETATKIAADNIYNANLYKGDDKDYYSFKTNGADVYNLYFRREISDNVKNGWRIKVSGSKSGEILDEIIGVNSDSYEKLLKNLDKNETIVVLIEARYASLAPVSINYNIGVSAHAHDFVADITKASFDTDGKVEYMCSTCGAEEKAEKISKIKSVTLSTTNYVYDGKNKTPKVTVKDANGKVLTKNVDYKTSVASSRSGVGRYTVKVTFIGNYEGSKSVYFYIKPGKTDSVKSASQTTSAVKLSWNAVPGAAGYKVYRYSPSKKAYVEAGTTTGTTLTVKSLNAGTKYTFRVVAYGKTSAGKVYDSDSYALLKTATKTATPTLSKVVSSAKGKATLTHTDVSGETGYTVYYSTSKDSGFKKYANFKADTSTCSITGLTSGKTYYFKVRTYITTDSGYVYSAWSTVKSVKVK